MNAEQTLGPVVQEPAIGYSIVANLGDNRQMTINCFVGENEKLSTIHSRVDKIMAVVDRQKAVYGLADLLEEEEVSSRTVQRFEDDLVRVHEGFEQSLAGMDAELKRLAEARDGIDAEAAVNGRHAGPVGHEKSRKSHIEREMKALMEQRDKAQAEGAQGRANALISLSRHKEALEAARAKIAKARALIEGAD